MRRHGHSKEQEHTKDIKQLRNEALWRIGTESNSKKEKKGHVQLLKRDTSRETETEICQQLAERLDMLRQNEANCIYSIRDSEVQRKLILKTFCPCFKFYLKKVLINLNLMGKIENRK